jgi:hypothetical protein
MPDFYKKLSAFDFENYSFKDEQIPFLRATMDDTGQMKVEYSDPKDPKKSFTTKVGHGGGFSGSENSGDKNFDAALNSGHKRSYVAEGNGSQTDGSSDTATEDTSNENVGGDKGSGTGKNRIEGTKGQATTGTSGGSFTNDAKGDTLKATKGDIATEHEGNKYSNHTGDMVNQVTGNKIEMIKGEYAKHVSSGNFDIEVSSGKSRIRSSSDMLFESDSKITLKVGGSTIEITASDITITAAAEIKINAKNDITTKGASTKVQGGGPVSPPTTFK